jgi:hypothetical protein
MIVIVLIILIITIILFVYVKNNIEKFDNHHYIAEGDEGIIGDSANAGKDVVWSPVIIPQDSFVTVPAIPGSTFEEGKNAVFKRFRECDIEKQYIIEDGEVGNASAVGKDRQCGDLLQCEYDTQYINTDILTNSVGYRTNNNSCADIISCTEYEDVIRPTMPAKMFNRGVCQRKGEIVVKLELLNNNDLFLKKKIYTGSSNEFSSIQSIKNYFSQLKKSEDKYNNYIDKTTEFFFAMDNAEIDLLGDKINGYHKIYDGFVTHMIDLTNNNTLNLILRKHLYLEISFIERMVKTVKGPIYLFVLGTQVGENIPMKLYNADNLVFALVYKDQASEDEDTTEYKFDLIKYDLDLLYEYNEEYAISSISTNMNGLEYFLKKTLFSEVVPKYKMQLYNKRGSNIQVTTTVFVGDKVLNVSQLEKSLTRCDFQPEGQTLFGCKNRCNSVQRCSNYDCNLICDNCENDNCLWTIKYKINKDLLAPDSVYVKGFSGDKLIKLTWMKPQSPSKIEKYYIIVSSPIDPDLLDIYSVQDKRDLCEYIISDLDNAKPYDVYVIVKNDVGISEKSNKVTVVPNEDSGMNIDDNEDSYSNSIENYYKQAKGDSFSLKKSISSFERKSVINDLKKIIKDDLKMNISSDSYNINIY